MMTYSLAAIIRERGGSLRKPIILREAAPSIGGEYDLIRSLALMISSIMRWSRANVTEVVKSEKAAFRSSVPIRIGGDATLADDVGMNARAIIEELRREVERAAATAEQRVRQNVRRIAEKHTRDWAAAVKVGAKVDVTALLRDDDLVDFLSVRSEQFNVLIRNLSNDIRQRIERETLRGIFEGRSNADVAKALSQIEGIGKSRARLLARDQASKLNGAMNEFRQKQAGITHFRWRTLIDGRERDSHRARNGKVYSWDKPPAGEKPGGPINCRCRALAVIIDDPADVAQLGTPEGDPADLFSDKNDVLISRVAKTTGEDVLSWGREALLVRQADTQRVGELIKAARSTADFTEANSEALFSKLFGFGSDEIDLTKFAGVSGFLARRRSLLFAAMKSRIELIEELLEHAILMAVIE
jgi:SPP1 gp7 family putative phage head morphogenesis protein